MRFFSILLLSTMILTACGQSDQKTTTSDSSDGEDQSYSVQKTEQEWKEQLSEQEYYVIREKGTERPGTSELLDNKEKGTYVCKACNNPLFKSDSKFESGTGWPSFYECIEGKVIEESDISMLMPRTEILCADCGGHLGHVFNDGPRPTGLRYCVNGVSLEFDKTTD